MTEIYTFQTEKQKKDASKLFDSLELISFPFLSTLNGKIEKDGSIHVENQIMPQNCIELFILKEKDLNKVIDEQKLFDFAAQGALVLSFLHKQKIVHGKISLKSVCIGEDNILLIGPVDFCSNFQEGDIKEGDFDRMQNKDLHNFGEILYALAELKEFQDNQDQETKNILPQNVQFERLSDGSTRQIIISLLTLNPDQQLSAEQLLKRNEIQERINKWKDIQTMPSSSFNSFQTQFSKFRVYLAQLLVEIAGASVEERLIISQRGEFVELINILKWARDQDRNIARPLQEWVCKAVELLICKNKESAQIGFQAGIVAELQTLLSKDLNLEEVKYIHINSLKLFTNYGGQEIEKKMFEMNIIQSIVHNLKSSYSKVVEKTLAIIYNIVRNVKGISEEPQKNLYLEKLQKEGIIIALYQDGIQNGANDIIRVRAAESIGQLYSNTPIPADMKEEVIKTLRNGVEIEIRDNDVFNLYFNLLALSCLAWNIDNHDEILKANFISKTQDILMIDDSYVHQYIFNMMLIILKIGSQQSQEILKKGLPFPQIREFTKNKDTDVKQFAFLLLSWVSRHEEMMKFEKLKKEIVGKSKNEITRLARDGLMEEIHSILREAKSNVEDNGGLVLVVCDVAQSLFKLNGELMKHELSENGFIDLLFQYYEAVLPSQFMIKYCDHLIVFIPLVQISDKLFFKKEKYLNSFIRFLDCKAESELFRILLTLIVILQPVNETGQIQQKDETRSFMENNGALNHLIQIFLHYQFTSNMGKGCCAIAISFLHKAMLLPDEFRGAMIEILKSLIENEENFTLYYRQQSANALKRLAENCGNHSDIISGNFATVLNKCISDTDTYTYDHGLILALNLLRFGSEDVQQKVKEGVPIERVRNLMTNLDDKIQLTAELLNQRIIAIS